MACVQQGLRQAAVGLTATASAVPRPVALGLGELGGAGQGQASRVTCLRSAFAFPWVALRGKDREVDKHALTQFQPVAK